MYDLGSKNEIIISGGDSQFEAKEEAQMKDKMVHVRCPVCGRGRLLDAVDQVSAAKLRLYGPRQLAKALWIVKCPKCGTQIGIAPTEN